MKRKSAGSQDLVYEACWKHRGRKPEDGSRSNCRCFRSTRFGDDQDRPIKKSDGSWTYFGADLAYHFQKAEAADELIDIWGADHAGTVKRIKAAVAALRAARRNSTSSWFRWCAAQKARRSKCQSARAIS